MSQMLQKSKRWVELFRSSNLTVIQCTEPQVCTESSLSQWPAQAQQQLIVYQFVLIPLTYTYPKTCFLHQIVLYLVRWQYETARCYVQVKSKHSRDQDLEHLDFHLEWPLQVECCCLQGLGWDCCFLGPTRRLPWFLQTLTMVKRNWEGKAVPLLRAAAFPPAHRLSVWTSRCLSRGVQAFPSRCGSAPLSGAASRQIVSWPPPEHSRCHSCPTSRCPAALESGHPLWISPMHVWSQL